VQLIERSDDVPTILHSRAATEGRERMRTFFARAATQRAQSPAPPPGLRSDDSELVEALSQMSDGKCAFCEARDELIAHRFRPPGNALPLAENRNSAHLYYLWLGDAWQNLYPICRGCVPKEPQFPVTGARAKLPQGRQLDNYVDSGEGVWPSFPPKESALLLDPTADGSYEKHLVPKLDGELIGESRRGEITALIYDLNRPNRRNQRYQSYHDRIERLLRLAKTAPAIDESDWDQLFNFSELEFGGSWYLMLRRIARWVAGAEMLRWRTSRMHIRAFFGRLTALDNPQELIRNALAAITREDDGLRA